MSIDEETALEAPVRIADRPALAPPHAVLARYAGYMVVLLFFGLAIPSDGFFVRYGPYFLSMSYGEGMLWLGHMCVLFPGCFLIGYGFSDRLSAIASRIAWKAGSLRPQEIVAFAFAVFGVALALARIGNAAVMRGFPLTDDEYAAMFGGRILAMGHAMLPRALPPGTFSELFLYARGDGLTSFDTLGAQVPWAFDALTGLGPLLYAAAAALPFVFVPMAVRRRFGGAWGAFALLVIATSPMAMLLSVTTHTHLLSRGLLAVALFCFVGAREDRRRWQWVVCGLAVGMSFACRPFETAFLVLPFAVLVVYEAVRSEHGARSGIAWFVVGAFVPLLGFALHSWAVTGNPFLPARLVPSVMAVRTEGVSLLGRFGINVSINFLALAICFLGPIGIALVPLGVTLDRLSRTLGASVASVLALGLFHADTGLHIVGPIHYSECVIPLTVLTVYGAVSVTDFLARHDIRSDPLVGAVICALLLGLGIFTAFNAVGLRGQARVQEELYQIVDSAIDSDGRKAVVIAPPFHRTWSADPGYALRQSWVREWRRPRPDLSDDVLIFEATANVGGLRARFPDRRFFRLVPYTDGRPATLVPLE